MYKKALCTLSAERKPRRAKSWQTNRRGHPTREAGPILAKDGNNSNTSNDDDMVAIAEAIGWTGR